MKSPEEQWWLENEKRRLASTERRHRMLFIGGQAFIAAVLLFVIWAVLRG